MIIAACGKRGGLIHITRNFARCAADILYESSIYWVAKGMLVGRNRILAFWPMMRDEQVHCGIVYEPKLIRILPRPRRPFLARRYLEGKDEPADLTSDMSELPDDMLKDFVDHHHKQMAYVNASIKQFCRSFIKSLFARSYMIISMNCKKIWTNGFIIIIMSTLIRVKCAADVHQCKH